MSLDMDVRIPKVEREAAATAASNFTERLWAYLTIRKLLDDMLELTETEAKAAAKAMALELSIKVRKPILLYAGHSITYILTSVDNKLIVITVFIYFSV